MKRYWTCIHSMSSSMNLSRLRSLQETVKSHSSVSAFRHGDYKSKIEVAFRHVNTSLKLPLETSFAVGHGMMSLFGESSRLLLPKFITI
jgi:hypothetical protein